MIGQTRARPVRVAFLVEENENWKEMLLAIFSNCYSRWGGRFNIIVPCKYGRPEASFVPWIKAYDPDIIYSYIQPERSTLLKIQERFDPARLEIHESCGGDQRVNFSPNDSVCGMSSISTLLGERDEVSRREIEMGSFFDKERNVDFPFLDYNFGTYGNCLGELPDHYSIQWQNICVLTPESGLRTKDNPHLPSLGIPMNKRNVCIRIHRYGWNRHPSILSAWKTPRAELRMNGVGDAFLLTVGETFEDYLMFWNTRSHIPQLYDRNIVSLIVSKQDLTDDVTKECVIELLAKHNFVKQSSSSSSAVNILSISESREALRNFVEENDKLKAHSTFEYMSFDSIEDVANRLKPKVGFSHDISYGDWGNPGGWMEFSYSGDSFRPPSIEPRYFGEFSTLSRYMYRGLWMQDVDIQRDKNLWKYDNLEESWMFPRKLKFVKRLFPNIGRWSCNFEYSPRSNIYGRISLFAKLSEQLPTVNLLDDETLLLNTILGVVVPNLDVSVRDYPMRRVAEEVQISVVGRHLTSLLSIAGGQRQAENIFLNPFWMKCFDELGTLNKRTEELRRSINDTLNESYTSLQESKADSIDEITEKILRHVQKQEKLQFGMTKKELEMFYGAYIKEQCKEKFRKEHGQWLGESIKYLVGKQILRPGLEWKCKKCSSRNWLNVDDLKAINKCEVCNTSETMPVPLEMRYVLDEFIQRGLRHQGLLACVWCLAYLRRIAEYSFGFCCSVELIDGQKGCGASTSNAKYNLKRRELDLLAMVDGKLYMCEIKSSTGWIGTKVWEKFMDNAMLVRPDVALMAVMNEEDEELRDGFLMTKEKLKCEDIGVELYTMTQSRDFPPSESLPVCDYKSIFHGVKRMR